MNPAGNALVYATYVGGRHYDTSYALKVDKDGNAWVAGTTYSDDFPVKNPVQATMKGAPDAFFCKLNAAGNGLIASSFLGGTADEEAYAITVDDSGNATLTGYTGSEDFPTKTPLQPGLAGFYNAFVTQVNPTGALIYSTYLGGAADDQGNAVAVDSQGNVYVTGYTSSVDFPTQTPFQVQLQGIYNAFVTKIAPGGAALVYSTFLGGSGDDGGYAIVVDKTGNTYLTGYVSSADFPTLNPLQATLNGEADVFVTKFNASGTALIYSTYLGGSSYEDYAERMAIDAAGNVYIAGWTGSSDFPLKAPLLTHLQGLYDAFVVKINSAGSKLIYSTYLGGEGIDQAYGLALDLHGNLYVAGGTNSDSFPTVNPFQGNLRGTDDGFITKIRAGSGLAGVLALLLGD